LNLTDNWNFFYKNKSGFTANNLSIFQSQAGKICSALHMPLGLSAGRRQQTTWPDYALLH
jgi:hypothetical protein